MGAVSIQPVESRKDLNTFIHLPWSVYQNNQYWVPPLLMDVKTALNKEKHPFYQHADVQHFLAKRDGKAVGRTSAVIDHNFNRFQGVRTGFFGFFECDNDGEAARELIGAVRTWLRDRGMTHMMGPTAPSTNDTMGILLDSFDDPPTVMMPYNPPYYPELLEGAGLAKEKDLYAYLIEAPKYDHDRFERITTLIKKRHSVTFRPINLKKLSEEVEIIKGIYNDAWEKNWGFVPWTDEEFQHLGKDLKPVAEADLVFIVYKDGEPVAFSITLPDMYQALIKVSNGRLLPFGIFRLMKYGKKVDRLRVLAFGVRKEFRNLGLDGLMIHESYKAAMKLGFDTTYECSWILEDNMPMRRSMERMGAYIYKSYRVYGEDL